MKLLVELRLKNILNNDILHHKDHLYGTCTFFDPRHESGIKPQHKPVPISSNVCGASYRHELVFSRTIFKSSSSSSILLSSNNNETKEEEEENNEIDDTSNTNLNTNNNTNFTIVKVASGGTQLYADWSSVGGKYWNALNDTIHNSSGSGWYGFVWHQGINDVFDTVIESNNNNLTPIEDTSLTYYNDLTQFITNVRNKMTSFNNNNNKIAKSNSNKDIDTIPVVIMGVHWPGEVKDNANLTQRYRRIIGAQKQFAKEDNSTIFVDLSDLTKEYFHLDAAALLIPGYRLSRAMRQLLLQQQQNNDEDTIVLNDGREEDDILGDGEDNDYKDDDNIDDDNDDDFIISIPSILTNMSTSTHNNNVNDTTLTFFLTPYLSMHLLHRHYIHPFDAREGRLFGSISGILLVLFLLPSLVLLLLLLLSSSLLFCSS